MDPQIYTELAAEENTHWWYRARRTLANRLLQRFPLPPDAKILDAGCGSGGNLPMLAKLGEIYGFELNPEARAHAIARGIGRIESGMLPYPVPFSGINFDLITLFDVLEHVENDRDSLSALSERMNPGGVLCITVPAFQWLYSQHDRLHHHFHRYNSRGLIEQVTAAGLKVEYVRYWNCLLFPVAGAARFIDRFRKPKDYALGSRTPPSLINKLLYYAVASESFLLPPTRFGLSLILVARKPAA